MFALLSSFVHYLVSERCYDASNGKIPCLARQADELPFLKNLRKHDGLYIKKSSGDYMACL